MAVVGTLFAEIRATTQGLRRDMADAVAITKQGASDMSQVLDQFGKPVFAGITDSAKRLRGPILDVDSGLRTLAKTSRGLVGPLSNELGPAFDGIGIRIAHVLTTSASLGSGMGALAIAAAGLAGVLGGALFSAWKKNTEEAAAFQSALNSMDTSRLQAELQKSLDKLEKIGAKLRELQGFEFPTEPGTGINPRTGEPRIPLGFLGQTPTGSAKSARDIELDKLRQRREAEKAAITGETEVAAFKTLQPMIDKIHTDAQKAQEDLLKQQEEARFASARKIGAAVEAEEQATFKESEKANQAHDKELEKIDQDRVQRNFAAGKAINDEVEATNRASTAFDVERLNEQKALEAEGLRSTLAAIDAETDAEIKKSQDLLAIDKERFRESEAARAAFLDEFVGVNFSISAGLDALIQQTVSVSKAFEFMARSIASSLIQNAVNRGLKVLEQAIADFIESETFKRLLKTLAGLFATGVTTGATASSSVGAIDTSGIGVFAQGGIVTKPTLAVVGESGPELIVPFDRLTGGGNIINVNNYSGEPVETRERRGANGQTITDIMIGAMKQAIGNGSMDGVLAPYGLRRQAVGR